jgi:8-oxo-dGTP pyrophosphatase MutT (NUDIX family)
MATTITIPEFGIKREDEERRDGGCAVIYNPKTNKFAVAQEDNDGLYRLFSGGVDTDENIQEGILREIVEESGLYDFKSVEKIAEAITHYHNNLRNLNRVAHATCLLIILNSTKTKPLKLEEHEKFHLTWVNANELLKNWRERNSDHDHDHWVHFFQIAQKKINNKNCPE